MKNKVLTILVIFNIVLLIFLLSASMNAPPRKKPFEKDDSTIFAHKGNCVSIDVLIWTTRTGKWELPKVGNTAYLPFHDSESFNDSSWLAILKVDGITTEDRGAVSEYFNNKNYYFTRDISVIKKINDIELLYIGGESPVEHHGLLSFYHKGIPAFTISVNLAGAQGALFHQKYGFFDVKNGNMVSELMKFKRISDPVFYF